MGLPLLEPCPSRRRKMKQRTHFSAWGHGFHTGFHRAPHGFLLPPAQPSASQMLVGITKWSRVHHRHLAPITRGPDGAEPGVLL